MTDTYTEPVSKLLELGFPEEPWEDYLALGLSQADIPELIRLLEDYPLRFFTEPEGLAKDEDLPECYAQIHAWRALAQLKAEEAIPALLFTLNQADNDDDEWIGEDAEQVFAMIGPVTIQPLGEFLLADENGTYARGAASDSLQKIALAYPESRSACIKFIAAALENYKEQDEGLNAFLAWGLVELKASEHIDLIKRAFEDDCVDEMVAGDFEDMQIELGLLAERTTPHKMPDFFDISRPLPSESPVMGPKVRKNEKKEKNKRKQEKKSRKKNRKKK
jgi:hypothetical protein